MSPNIPMRKYVIITPARDEEQYIERTIHAVAGQSIRPAQWILVNDGSCDATGEIIDRYAASHAWITAVHRSNRGHREAGGGVVRTFYDGYAKLKSMDWDFLVKLDADLSFSPDYFERCFAEFDSNLSLGIGGGGVYHEVAGQLKLEHTPKFHVRGATKIYRRECWDELGGLLPAPGWDTVDELKANMLGWTTRSFLKLCVSHYRFTGSADGAWRNSIKDGRANYVAGYHPLFMLLKCVRRLARKPYVSGSTGLMYGFLSGYWKQTPQVEDRQLIHYTRDQQIRRLLLQESIWK
ncbi:MAG: glycosyl transferase family 2 [Acidobacteriales bacterium 59-55]|nr:MAG: glycosyl transferase family 2 [Acidobacteriales bacterium 59-55]